MPRLLSGLLLLLLLLPATGVRPASAQSPADRVAAAVNPRSIEAHVRHLASDSLEGRAPGTRGGELAARYIEAQFRRLGLEPAGTDGYRHRVDIISLDPRPTLALGGTTLAWRDDYVLWSMRNDSEVRVAGEAVFVGHGIVAPEHQWNDYAGVDVRGKVVIALVNDPGLNDPSLFEGSTLTYYGRWTYKLEEAARQGAAGILLVHTPESATYGWQTVAGSWTGPQVRIETPPTSLVVAGWLQEPVAARALSAAGRDLADLTRAAGRRGFRAVPLEVPVEAGVTSTVVRSHTANILGRLPGSGPHAADVVIIGGHYDHLGVGLPVAGDSIYNGAVDNAAGVGTVIGVAEAFVESGVKPGRSIVFMAFGAEESGLLGSAAYVAMPTTPLAHTAAVINIDGLSLAGATRDFSALGDDQSSLGDDFRVAAAAEQMVTTVDEEAARNGSFFRSDHFPFVKAGVPALSFEAGVDVIGREPGYGQAQREDYRTRRYHQPADEWFEGASVEGPAQAARLAARIAVSVGAAADQPTWNNDSAFRSAGEERRR